jgi:hypothetical protein
VLISCDELKQWLGYERTADVVRWLDRNGVAWRPGKDKQPCTTLDAVTHALEGQGQQRPARFA